MSTIGQQNEEVSRSEERTSDDHDGNNVVKKRSVSISSKHVKHKKVCRLVHMLKRKRASKKKTSRTMGIMIVMLSVTIDMLGVSIILPILPFYALKFGASSFEVGMVFAAYALTQMISVPISGWLSDKYGRRPALLMSLVGSFGGFLFQGFSNSLLVFLLARGSAGLFGGSIPIAQAYIADVTTPQERPKFLAAMGSVITLAFLIGPSIGAGLAEFSLNTPMFVSAGLAAFGVTFAFFAFEEPQAHLDRMRERKERVAQEAATTTASAESLDASPAPAPPPEEQWESSTHFLAVKLLWLAAFLLMFSFTAFLALYGLLLLDVYGYGSLELGFSFMGQGVVTMLGQLLIFPIAQKKMGKHVTGALGALLYSVALFLIPIPTHFGWMVPILFIFSVGWSCMQPALPSLLSRYAPPSMQGSVLGNNQAMQALARVVGPLVMGALYSVNRRIPFFVGGGVGCVYSLILLITLYLNRQMKRGRSRGDSMELHDDEIMMDDLSDKGIHVTESQLQHLGGRVLGLLRVKGYYELCSQVGQNVFDGIVELLDDSIDDNSTNVVSVTEVDAQDTDDFVITVENVVEGEDELVEEVYEVLGNSNGEQLK